MNNEATLAKATARIRELQDIGPDWDDEGSPAPTPELCAAAVNLVTRICRHMPEGLPEPFICPMPDGRIQVEWCHDDRHVELELLLGGKRILWLAADKLDTEPRMIDTTRYRYPLTERGFSLTPVNPHNPNDQPGVTCRECPICATDRVLMIVQWCFDKSGKVLLPPHNGMHYVGETMVSDALGLWDKPTPEGFQDTWDGLWETDRVFSPQLHWKWFLAWRPHFQVSRAKGPQWNANWLLNISSWFF